MILVLAEGESFDEKELEVLKKYKVRDIITAPVEYKAIAAAVAMSLEDDQEPRSVQSQMRAAKDLFREGIVKKSREIFEKILVTDKNNLVAETGILHGHPKKSKMFEDQLMVILEKDPENYNFKFEKIKNLFLGGEDSKASQCAMDILSDLSHAKDDYWAITLADVCLSLGMNDLADNVCRYMTGNEELFNKWQIEFLTSRCMLSRGSVDMAWEYAQRAHRNSPTPSSDVLNLLGILCAKREQFEQAREYFMASLMIAEDDYRTLYNLALSLKQMGDYEGAKQFCEDSLKVNPNYRRSIKLLGELDELRKRAS